MPDGKSEISRRKFIWASASGIISAGFWGASGVAAHPDKKHTTLNMINSRFMNVLSGLSRLQARHLIPIPQEKSILSGLA